jgi:Flp pilus assembly pilin Flp
MMKRFEPRSWMGRRGQTMTEYAMIMSTVAVVALATYRQLGSLLSSLLNSVIAGL